MGVDVIQDKSLGNDKGTLKVPLSFLKTKLTAKIIRL